MLFDVPEMGGAEGAERNVRLATQVQARTQQRAAENGLGLLLLVGTHGANLAGVLS
jgi:hypothetical protein